MFVQYAALGLWSVTVGTYIGENTAPAGTAMFSSSFVGLAGIASAVGALVAPLLFGALADSWFRTDRMITLLNLACGAMLVLMWSSTNQWWFLAAIIGYYQCSVPALTLTHSLTLRHLAGSRELFSIVRASGTAGWILAMVIVGSLVPWYWGMPSKLVDASTWPMKMGATVHGVMIILSFALPKTMPQAGRGSWRTLLHGCRALLAMRPRLVRFLIVSFIATISAQFYNTFANLYLNNKGVENAATKLSLGQVVEIVCMLLLPVLLVRWGPKRVFMIGVVAWIVRFLCLAYGSTEGLGMALIYTAIMLHGVCYVFVYITGYIYVDHAATPHTQSAAQGMLAMATSGLGHFSGSLLSGFMQARYLTPAGVEVPPYDWRSFYMVAAGVSVVALVLFFVLMGFKREVMPDDIDPHEAV
ncbi:Putative nucleoside transporter YegT [Aeoliella mucimassa]|uniref:Nucleoside transporter YegT n=2 Tax=Aeoliella mucimassa TaxID=2527972 RepID=A0A518AJJ6_9BACT|nr:Putative nucleoside transporter YegT [Aeoliella mucimassa]